MSSLISWPFKRKQYSGLTNPIYVSDIVAANEAVIDAMKSIGGFSATGFAILSGIVYDSVAHIYTAGIFYLNGSFYSIDQFNEGVYLIGSLTDIKISPFPDSTTKPIYTALTGTTTNNSFGASPIFSGSMDVYRINLSKLKIDLSTVQTFIETLGDAATKNVGTVAGTVADGAASYSRAYIDDKLSTVTRTIGKGSVNVGNPSGDQAFIVSFATVGTGNYYVLGSIVSNSSSGNVVQDATLTWAIRNRSDIGFTLQVHETGNYVQDVSFEYVLIAK